MAPKPYPSCARILEHTADACPSCGWTRDGMRSTTAGATGEAASARNPGPASDAGGPGDARALPPEPALPLFPTSLSKLVVLSICTFGLYNLAWTYRCWRRLRDVGHADVSPFWRTAFSGLFGFGLFHRIAGVADRERLPPPWSPGLLGAGYFAMGMVSRLPDPWWMLALLSVLPLVPAVRTVNALNDRRREPLDRNDRWSGANIATAIIGAILLLVVVNETFFPSAPHTPDVDR